MKKFLLPIIIILALSVIGLGTSKLMKVLSVGPEKDEKITIALNDWAGYAPIIYAQYLGLYKKYNLNVEVRFINNPAESNSEYRNGHLDAFPVVLADAIYMKANDIDGKVVLLTNYSLEGDALMASKKYKNLKDLKGKTFGINAINSFSHIFVLEALKTVGLTERDINLLIVPFDQITNALDEKRIDVGHTWHPGKAGALKNNYKSIFSAKDVPGLITEGIMFHDSMIENKKSEIKKFVKIFYEAQESMLKNPKDAALSMSKFFNNNPNTFMYSFNEIHFINEIENKSLMAKENTESIVYKNNILISKFYEKNGLNNKSNLANEIMTEEFLK